MKVLIALSGGIDSAVSAYLLKKAGHEVEAAFMKNWSSTAGLLRSECPWLADRQDALRVAAFLRILLHTLDFEKQYRRTVMDYFFREYSAGRTPNPDVACNKEIKFKLLYDWAAARGFDYLATGHYAQIKKISREFLIKNSRKKDKIDEKQNKELKIDAQESNFGLFRSADEFKDQTYFIYNIKREQLPHLLFPVGGMKKTAVRALAKKLHLPNADRKESMGLCFVGKIRLKDFLEQKLKPKPGAIIDQKEKKIGEHRGLHYYTIGQRQGIRVGATGPYYVTKKDLKTNTLYVTNNEKDKNLFAKEIQLHSLNWINRPKKFPAKLKGRFRHQGDLQLLTIRPVDKNHYQIKFAKPQKAVASGQSLVLYNKMECVGGGVIG